MLSNIDALFLVVVVVAALFMCYPLYEHYEAFSHPDHAILFALNCLMFPQLVFPDGAREQSPVETSEINEREHKNLADGLAWGYYFGYLKLVLPKLEEQIAKSEQFRYEITMKKLFILLPQDCFTEDNIEDADDRVKWAGNLPECKRNRGGIKARSYKHAVHLIEMPNPEGGVDKCHVILEYATPLMTLYDMSMSKLAALSDQERDHQVRTISQCKSSTYLIGQPLFIFSWSNSSFSKRKMVLQVIKSPEINHLYPRACMVKTSNEIEKKASLNTSTV